MLQSSFSSRFVSFDIRQFRDFLKKELARYRAKASSIKLQTCNNYFCYILSPNSIPPPRLSASLKFNLTWVGK